MLRIAVISDLHVGTGARGADLWPSGTGEAGLDSGYVSTFVEFINGIGLEPDYLLCPGDVAHTGQPDEIQLASDTILTIAAALGLDESQVWFVPGNHDVDWAVMKLPDATGLRKAMRYYPLRNPPWLFDRVMRAADRHILDSPHCHCVWETSDVFVLGLNSSSHDAYDAKVHHGWIPQDTIDQARLLLAGRDLSSKTATICLLHHHPIQYSDPLPDEPDFSALTNAGNLLDLLREFRFDFLIHGHKHAPQFDVQQLSGGHPLAILCAGSFSARLDPRWSGIVNNQFHVVDIDGRDADGHLRGSVLSWTYLSGHGWRPSEPANGIYHRIPFGVHVGVAHLEKVLEVAIRSALTSADYVTWDALQVGIPDLIHTSPTLQKELLRRIKDKVGCIVHGSPPDPVVLLLPTGGLAP